MLVRLLRQLAGRKLLVWGELLKGLPGQTLHVGWVLLRVAHVCGIERDADRHLAREGLLLGRLVDIGIVVA